MKIRKALFVVTLLFILQACLFGAGKIEREITDDYWLFANTFMEEMSIWKKSNQIVEAAVFAVGYNDNFIIVKSHPQITMQQINRTITQYYIIELDKAPEKSSPMMLEEFELKRKQLDIPSDLDFTIVYEELK